MTQPEHQAADIDAITETEVGSVFVSNYRPSLRVASSPRSL